MHSNEVVKSNSIPRELIGAISSVEQPRTSDFIRFCSNILDINMTIRYNYFLNWVYTNVTIVR